MNLFMLQIKRKNAGLTFSEIVVAECNREV